MEGLDFNQRIKYDFLFLQMGEDGGRAVNYHHALFAVSQW